MGKIVISQQRPKLDEPYASVKDFFFFDRVKEFKYYYVKIIIYYIIFPGFTFKDPRDLQTVKGKVYFIYYIWNWNMYVLDFSH